MHQTLTIPQHKDPVARAALAGCATMLAWLVLVGGLPQASASEQPRTIIVVATPTLPQLAPRITLEAAPPPREPAAELSAPTVAPELLPTAAPIVPTPEPIVVYVPAEAPTPEPAVPAIGERESDKGGPPSRVRLPTMPEH